MSSEQTPSPRFFGWTLGILTGLHVLLMALMRIYPFVDLPNRLAAATIFRYYGQATNEFEKYYSLPTLFKPNILHLAFCGLPIFPTVEIANKVYLCLYVALVPLSTALLIRRLRGNLWFSFLAFLPVYNFILGWGLVECAMAIPFTLLLLYVFVLHFSAPSRFTFAAVTCGLVGIFFVHAQAALFALMLFFALTMFLIPRSALALLKQYALALPLIFVFFLWWLRDWSKTEPSQASLGTLTALLDYYAHQYLGNLMGRASPLLVADNWFLGKTVPMIAVGMFFFLVILSVSVPGLISVLRAPTRTLARERLLVPAVFLLCSLFCYCFLPENLPGHQFVSPRFAVFVLLALSVLGSVASTPRLSRARIGLILATVLLHLGLWASYFTGFQSENAAFTKEVLPADPSRGPMGCLIYDYRYRGQPIYIHFPNYQIIWNQGIATTRLIDYRFGVVRRLVPETSLPVYHDWVGGGDSYRGWYSNLNAILVRGVVPRSDETYLADYLVTKRADGWSLYERRRAN